MSRGAHDVAIDVGGWARSTAATTDIVPSPNHDARPDGVEPSLIVVHNISLPPGEFGSRAIDALFTNTLDLDAHPYYAGLRDLHVSSHFLVRRTGELVQFVSCAMRAWHAGVSTFEGRERCNDFSIGIELEGDDDHPFEAAQYQVLAGLIDALARRYPIGAIAGHNEIAAGRKSDPGPFFDWARVLAATAPALSLRRPAPPRL